MIKAEYLLALCLLVIVYNAVTELRRFIRNKERGDAFQFLTSVYICVCIIISIFTSFSVKMNLYIMGLAALFIVLIPWVFIRMRIK